jgi:hypothetical protein
MYMTWESASGEHRWPFAFSVAKALLFAESNLDSGLVCMCVGKFPIIRGWLGLWTMENFVY